ncbi:phage tail assembly chaperone [uncultured Mediterranean phage uvMED]|nr:phage tail assembly chaperone [uncultured Mediterranean phage uvMED]
MAPKRSVDIITEAFSEVMSNRRKYELKGPKDEILGTLYFKPLTRFDRIQAQAAAGSDEALAVSTRLLCQLAEKEDGSKFFASADAENLKRFLPETVLNDLELFMMGLNTDFDQAKNE